MCRVPPYVITANQANKQVGCATILFLIHTIGGCERQKQISFFYFLSSSLFQLGTELKNLESFGIPLLPYYQPRHLPNYPSIHTVHTGRDGVYPNYHRARCTINTQMQFIFNPVHNLLYGITRWLKWIVIISLIKLNE